MRNKLAILLLTAFLAGGCGAQNLNDLKKKAESTLKSAASSDKISNDDAIGAIKEALIQGVSKGSTNLAKLDGFYKNPEVKIPFPPAALKVESTLRSVGLGSMADDAILSINRAAEDAAVAAKDIFVSAIKEMTVTDAMNIVKGDTNAATNYLKAKTTAKLTASFSPKIDASLKKVNATKYWETAMTAYNKIPMVEKVNPNLTEYVTQKAMDALFMMVAKEEALIRKDPIARTTELLKKVFGKK